MTQKTPFRHTFPAAAALVALAAVAPVPAGAAELVCRANDDFRVEVDGAPPPGARFFVADARGKLLLDIPSQSNCVLIDLPTKQAVEVTRADIKRGATEGIVRVADPGAWGAPAYALSIEGPVLRFQTDTSEVRIQKVSRRPPIGGSIEIEAAAEGASAKACLRLESRSAASGIPGCTKFIYVKNSCDVPVVAEVRRTEHLFSGTLPQTFQVVVPPGGEQSLGCAWWSGAMAPSGHNLLAARFLVVPTAPETGEPHCSTRH